MITAFYAHSFQPVLKTTKEFLRKIQNTQRTFKIEIAPSLRKERRRYLNHQLKTMYTIEYTKIYLRLHPLIRDFNQILTKDLPHSAQRLVVGRKRIK